jgi:hypothetical protein
MLAWELGSLIKLNQKNIDKNLTVITSETIKNKSNQEAVKLKEIERFSYYLIDSFSVHYYSLLMTAQVKRSELLYGGINPVFIPLKAIFYRLDYLSGHIFQIEKPIINSISQLNYRALVKKVTNFREGSSPGFLGSFNYVFPFPFNIILCVLYLYFVSKIVDVLLDNGESKVYSMVSLLFIYLYFRLLFQSPFDLLDVIDNATFYVALLFTMICIKLYDDEKIKGSG